MCLESSFESDTSSEIRDFQLETKWKWIIAFQKNILIKKWQLPFPLHSFTQEVTKLLQHLYQENSKNNHADYLYLLIVMWNDINGEIEDEMGDINIAYEDWIELLSAVRAELFARVVFDHKIFNPLIRKVA